MLFIILIKIYDFSAKMSIRYPLYMVYIYLGILIINTLVNIIFLGIVDIDNITSLFNGTKNSCPNIDEPIIIFKISPDNSDLVQGDIKTMDIESNKKIDSVDANININDNKDECKGKIRKRTFLDDIHRYILCTDSYHFPSYIQKNDLPKVSEVVPAYGDKLVTFKPSSLLHNRNLPEMSIEIPKNTSMGMGKLTELHKAIDGADEAVKLYDSQFIKFNKVLCGIKNGTEEFYPNDAKPLMETYVDLVAKLSDQQKIMANEAITQLQKLDSKFSRGLYQVEHSGVGPVTGTGMSTDTGTASVTGSGPGNSTGSGNGSRSRSDSGSGTI